MTNPCPPFLHTIKGAQHKILARAASPRPEQLGTAPAPCPPAGAVPGRAGRALRRAGGAAPPQVPGLAGAGANRQQRCFGGPGQRWLRHQRPKRRAPQTPGRGQRPYQLLRGAALPLPTAARAAAAAQPRAAPRHLSPPPPLSRHPPRQSPPLPLRHVTPAAAAGWVGD